MYALVPRHRIALYLLALGGGAPTVTAPAQGTSEYVPGKVYVIGISAPAAERIAQGTPEFETVMGRLKATDGVLEHVGAFIHPMMRSSDRKWVLVYFNPDRQSELDLRQDHYLLNWALHGHDVQVIPLESMASPTRLSDLDAASGSPR